MDYYEPPVAVSHFEQLIFTSDREVNIKQVALSYMQQLDGWCSDAKASFLINTILKNQPEVVVEIGVFGGKSLVPMAYALKMNQKGKIYGIDPWETFHSLAYMSDESNRTYWQNIDHSEIMQKLVQKISQFDLQNQILLIKKSSQEAEPINSIDLLHIDGNHSEEASYLDITKWVPLVKKGGWIILDDLNWNENGVYTQTKSIDYLNTNCTKIIESHNSIDGSWGVWMK